MRTNILAYVLGTEHRQKIVRALFAYPKRQWSCSTLEEITKLPHATVLRTLWGLRDFGMLKSSKINKKDIIYELVQESKLIPEIERGLNVDQNTARSIAGEFAQAIKSKDIKAIILYGSTVKGGMKPESDIDLLIILKKHNQEREYALYDQASTFSSKYNKTISPLIMDSKEIKTEKEGQFLRSVKESMEVLYGKTPF